MPKNKDNLTKFFSDYYDLCVEQNRTIKQLERQIEEMKSLTESDKRHIEKLYDWVDKLILEKNTDSKKIDL